MCLTYPEQMRTASVQDVFQAVFQEVDVNLHPKVYELFIEMLATLYQQDFRIPECILYSLRLSIDVLTLYLKDSCNDRKWVDEKKHRRLVTRNINLIRSVMSTCIYSFLPSCTGTPWLHRRRVFVSV